MESDDINDLTNLLETILDPRKSLSEQERSEIQLLKMVHNKFSSLDALKHMMQLQENPTHTIEDTFAAGILAHLNQEGLIVPLSHIQLLWAREVITHYLRIYHAHLKGDEI